MRVLHFADLHLGVEVYGHIDPATGLSSRLLDFLSAFDQLVDYALTNKVDIVVFCGDAYKSREPSPTHQREFAKRINRLALNGIPVFLLVGNHDLPNARGRATSTEIFDTLALKNIYVSNSPDVYRIHTNSGIVQVVSLPWPRRSALLAREEARALPFEQISQKLQEILTDVIAKCVARLDPALPSVLVAHVWVSGAKTGSEKSMTIGQEHVLLPSNIANQAFDYVALGHIHRRQVLCEATPVVYAGSLERLDFGEEDDEKGFYVVDITQKEDGKKQVSFEFHPISGRRFLTIDVNIRESDIDPTARILNIISENRGKIRDAIVRLQISLPASLEGLLRDIEIRNALKEAHYFSIARDIRREARLRLGNLTAEELTPLEALKAFINTSKISEDRAKQLLEYGEKLIQEQAGR